MNQTPLGINVLTQLELYFSVRHTLRSMRQFGEIFAHDYDLTIIFLTVAEVGFRAIFHLAAVSPNEIDVAEAFRDSDSGGLSVLSIGETTGIPRETIRRKVRWLIDNGYLAMKEKDKSIYIPASTITSPEMLEILASQVAEVSKLVKTVRFYIKDNAEN